MEKWLLALWQASRKPTWCLWRGKSPISLEYLAQLSEVRYQVHFSHGLLADVSSAILPAHFPGIEISSEQDDAVERAFNAGGKGAVCSFTLRSPGWIELPKDSSPEGVAGLLGAFGQLKADEMAVVQLLLEPTWMTTEDGRQPAFWLVGRLATFANAALTARRRANMISATFGQYARFNGLHFSCLRNTTKADVDAIVERRWPRRLFPPGKPATASQVASLYHPPAEAPQLGPLRRSMCLKTPAPLLPNGILLGQGLDTHGDPSPLRLLPKDLLRHGLVIGPSGSGKTTFLAHLARELASAGQGVTVIDPHGSLVRTIARTLPVTKRQAFLFRLADSDYPIALNPLKARPGQEFLATDELVEVVQRVYGREYWGPHLDLVLRHAALASIELGGSLVETARLLDDPWFREQALARLGNAETIRFLSQLSGESAYDRRFLPALHRLQRLLATPWLRNILGQTGRGLDFGQIFDEGSIALFDLSGIGATNARLLGSLLLLLIRQATLARATDVESRPSHFVLVDEASWFISRTVAELLDQARKFGVGIVLAVQRLGQLSPEDTREAVLANAANLVTFRITDREEATFLSRHLASERLAAHDLQHLPRYEAYAQLTRDGDRLEPAWLRMPAPDPEPTDGQQMEERLIAAARQRYARPRAVVEAELQQREHLLSDDEEPEVRTLAHAPGAVPAHAARPSYP